MERSILNIKKVDRIANSNIWEKTKMKELGYIMKRFTFKFAGHIRSGVRIRPTSEKLYLTWP